MKKFIATIAFASMIAAPAFAANTVKKTTTTTTTTTKTVPATEPTPVPGTTTQTLSITRSNTVEWSGQFAFGDLGSNFNLGAIFNGKVPVQMGDENFKFGGRAGFLISTSTPAVWNIPLLVTGEYEFKANFGGWKPYAGLGLGVSIYHVNAQDTNVGGNLVYHVDGTSGVKFMWSITPGATFGENDRYYVELPLGTIGSSFYILPSIGIRFN